MVSIIEYHDLLIELAAVFFSTFLAVFTFRLARFFKHGIFYSSYRLLWPAFSFYSIGSFFDFAAYLSLDPTWFQIITYLNLDIMWLHITHALGHALFFVFITLSVYRFYRAWLEMGMKEV